MKPNVQLRSLTAALLFLNLMNLASIAPLLPLGVHAVNCQASSLPTLSPSGVINMQENLAGPPVTITLAGGPVIHSCADTFHWTVVQHGGSGLSYSLQTVPSVSIDLTSSAFTTDSELVLIYESTSNPLMQIAVLPIYVLSDQCAPTGTGTGCDTNQDSYLAHLGWIARYSDSASGPGDQLYITSLTSQAYYFPITYGMTTNPHIPPFLPTIDIQAGDLGTGFQSASTYAFLMLDQVASDSFGIHMASSSPSQRQIWIRYISDLSVPLKFEFVVNFCGMSPNSQESTLNGQNLQVLYNDGSQQTFTTGVYALDGVTVECSSATILDQSMSCKTSSSGMCPPWIQISCNSLPNNECQLVLDPASDSTLTVTSQHTELVEVLVSALPQGTVHTYQFTVELVSCTTAPGGGSLLTPIPDSFLIYPTPGQQVLEIDTFSDDSDQYVNFDEGQLQYPSICPPLQYSLPNALASVESLDIGQSKILFQPSQWLLSTVVDSEIRVLTLRLTNSFGLQEDVGVHIDISKCAKSETVADMWHLFNCKCDQASTLTFRRFNWANDVVMRPFCTNYGQVQMEVYKDSAGLPYLPITSFQAAGSFDIFTHVPQIGQKRDDFTIAKVWNMSLLANQGLSGVYHFKRTHGNLEQTFSVTICYTLIVTGDIFLNRAEQTWLPPFTISSQIIDLNVHSQLEPASVCGLGVNANPDSRIEMVDKKDTNFPPNFNHNWDPNDQTLTLDYTYVSGHNAWNKYVFEAWTEFSFPDGTTIESIHEPIELLRCWRASSSWMTFGTQSGSSLEPTSLTSNYVYSYITQAGARSQLMHTQYIVTADLSGLNYAQYCGTYSRTETQQSGGNPSWIMNPPIAADIAPVGLTTFQIDFDLFAANGGIQGQSYTVSIVYYYNSPAPTSTEYAIHSEAFFYQVVSGTSCNVVDIYKSMWIDSLATLHMEAYHEDHVVLNYPSNKVYTFDASRFNTYSSASCQPFTPSSQTTLPSFLTLNSNMDANGDPVYKLSFDETATGYYAPPNAVTQSFVTTFNVCSNSDEVCLSPPTYFYQVTIIVHNCDFKEIQDPIYFLLDSTGNTDFPMKWNANIQTNKDYCPDYTTPSFKMKHEVDMIYLSPQTWLQNVINVPSQKISIDTSTLDATDVKIWDVMRFHSLAVEEFKLTICQITPPTNPTVITPQSFEYDRSGSTTEYIDLNQYGFSPSSSNCANQFPPDYHIDSPKPSFITLEIVASQLRINIDLSADSGTVDETVIVKFYATIIDSNSQQIWAPAEADKMDITIKLVACSQIVIDPSFRVLSLGQIHLINPVTLGETVSLYDPTDHLFYVKTGKIDWIEFNIQGSNLNGGLITPQNSICGTFSITAISTTNGGGVNLVKLNQFGRFKFKPSETVIDSGVLDTQVPVKFQISNTSYSVISSEIISVRDCSQEQSYSTLPGVAPILRTINDGPALWKNDLNAAFDPMCDPVFVVQHRVPPTVTWTDTIVIGQEPYYANFQVIQPTAPATSPFTVQLYVDAHLLSTPNYELKIVVTNSAGIITETDVSQLYFARYNSNYSRFWTYPTSYQNELNLDLHLIKQQSDIQRSFKFNNDYNTNQPASILEIKAEPLLILPHAAYTVSVDSSNEVQVILNQAFWNWSSIQHTYTDTINIEVTLYNHLDNTETNMDSFGGVEFKNRRVDLTLYDCEQGDFYQIWTSEILSLNSAEDPASHPSSSLRQFYFEMQTGLHYLDHLTVIQEHPSICGAYTLDFDTNPASYKVSTTIQYESLNQRFVIDTNPVLAQEDVILTAKIQNSIYTIDQDFTVTIVDCSLPVQSSSSSGSTQMPQQEYTHLIRDPVDSVVIWPSFPGSAHFICDWGWYVQCTDKYGRKAKTGYGVNSFASQDVGEKCSRWFTFDVYSQSITTQAGNIFDDEDEAINSFEVGYVNLNAVIEDPTKTFNFKINLFFDCDSADVQLTTALEQQFACNDQSLTESQLFCPDLTHTVGNLEDKFHTLNPFENSQPLSCPNIEIVLLNLSNQAITSGPVTLQANSISDLQLRIAPTTTADVTNHGSKVYVLRAVYVGTSNSAQVQFSVTFIEPAPPQIDSANSNSNLLMNSSPTPSPMMPSQITLVIDQPTTVSFGPVRDAQGDSILLVADKTFVESAVTGKVSWATLSLHKVKDQIELVLVAKPDQNALDQVFTLHFVLEDDHPTDSKQSIVYKVTIKIVADEDKLIENTDLDQSSELRRRRQQEAPQVRILQPNNEGQIYFYFNREVLLRNDFKTLNSTNEGAEILEISYKPSVPTTNYLQEREEEENKFSWHILEATPRLIILQADFDRPEFVSPQKNHPDTIEIKFLNLTEFRGSFSLKELQLDQVSFQYKVEQQYSPIQSQQIKIAKKSLNDTMTTFLTLNTLVSLLLSSSLSLLWGMINSLQIIVVPVNFHLPFMPANINNVLVGLFKLVTFDFFGNFVSELLKVETQESYSEIFSQSGLDGHNFVSLSGFILPGLFFYFCYIGIHKVARYLFLTEPCSKRFKRWLLTEQYQLGFVRFFLESCFDLLLSAIICIKMIHKTQLTPVDIVSDSIAFLSLVPLILAPFYLIKAIRLRLTGTYEQRFKVDPLFDGLKRRKVFALCYNFLFIGRRYLLVFLTMLTTDEASNRVSLYQGQVHTFLSLYTLFYLISQKPYINPNAGRIEIVNEVFVLMTTYHMIAFTEFVYVIEDRVFFGWTFFFFIGCSAIFNILLILMQHMATVKRKVKKYVQKRRKRMGIRGKEAIKKMLEEVSLQKQETLRNQFRNTLQLKAKHSRNILGDQTQIEAKNGADDKALKNQIKLKEGGQLGQLFEERRRTKNTLEMQTDEGFLSNSDIENHDDIFRSDKNLTKIELKPRKYEVQSPRESQIIKNNIRKNWNGKYQFKRRDLGAIEESLNEISSIDQSKLRISALNQKQKWQRHKITDDMVKAATPFKLPEIDPKWNPHKKIDPQFLPLWVEAKKLDNKLYREEKNIGRDHEKGETRRLVDMKIPKIKQSVIQRNQVSFNYHHQSTFRQMQVPQPGLKGTTKSKEIKYNSPRFGSKRNIPVTSEMLLEAKRQNKPLSVRDMLYGIDPLKNPLK